MKTFVRSAIFFGIFCGPQSSAFAEPWLEKRADFIINWSQLNIQFTSSSTEQAVASIQQQGGPETTSFKSHELAAWQSGVQNLHSLLKDLIAESSVPGAALGRLEVLDSLRPYSSNTIYKSSGFIDILFRFDLAKLAVAGENAEVSLSNEKNSNLMLIVPPRSKPKLALDLCFEGGERVRSASIEASQWSKRLGGMWIKKQSSLPKELTADSFLKVNVESISEELCAHIKGNLEQKALIQALYKRGAVYWVSI